MARPWEYPRWRRVLMQAAMWVVFAGALGLAQLVIGHHQLAPIVMDSPVRLGPLSIRLPKGWVPSPEQDFPGTGIEVTDEEQRDLTIVVQRLPEGQRGIQDLDQPGMGTQPIIFKGLNRPGVIVELPRKKVATTDGTTTTEEMMVALTDLPSGHEVEIRLRQYGMKMGAGERQLIETVASEITWVGPMPPTKRPPTMPRGPVL